MSEAKYLQFCLFNLPWDTLHILGRFLRVPLFLPLNFWASRTLAAKDKKKLLNRDTEYIFLKYIKQQKLYCIKKWDLPN